MDPEHGKVLEQAPNSAADVYRRRGNYHLDGSPPYILGYEGAGTVVEVAGDAAFGVGDREGAQAHRLLESRKSAGKILLIP